MRRAIVCHVIPSASSETVSVAITETSGVAATTTGSGTAPGTVWPVNRA